MSNLSNLIFKGAAHNVTSPYGPRNVIKTSAGNTSSFHDGTDYGTGGKKIPQFAADDGTIFAAAKSNSDGANYVWIIYEARKLAMLHYHLDSYKVKAGQKVKKGDLLGYTGMTGKATGIHLHLGVRPLSSLTDSQVKNMTWDLLRKCAYTDPEKVSFPTTVATTTAKTTSTTTTAKTSSTSTTSTFKVGDTVTIVSGAKSYDGKKLNSSIYGKKYKIDELKGSRAVLDMKGICTAVNTKDLKKVYVKGIYKVTCDLLHVRTGAGTTYKIKTFKELTDNAKTQIKSMNKGKEADGLVKNCTCTVSSVSGNWGKIPSGWICLDYCAEVK